MNRMNKSLIGLFLFMILLSCQTTKKVKDGQTAYELKQYARAIEFLENEIIQLKEGEEYAQTAYMLGTSYKNINDSENSLRWFIESAKNGYGPDAFYEMAYMLKKNERYEDAELSFQRLLKMVPSRSNELKKEIEKCRLARRWSAAQGQNKYTLKALEINSTQSDYSPFLYSSDKIVFTSDRIIGQSPVYNWTGNGFSDLYLLDLDKRVVTPFAGELNTMGNEGTAVFTKERDEVYFTRCYSDTGDSHCRIMRSKKLNGKWADASEAFVQKSTVNYGDPMLIENDSVLIFSSNDPIGIGGHDLYYSLRLEDDSWSLPELMPPYLNSLGAERFPTWDQDSQTLYYSSDFFPGLGGLDLFKTTLKEDGSWSNPVNLYAPFNSSEDDYAYTVVPEEYLKKDEELKVYFTSTRGVFGNDDLYSLTEYKLTSEDNTTEEVVEKEIVIDTPKKNFFLEVNVKEKIYAVSNNPNSYVVGTKDVSSASVRIRYNDREEIFTTNDKGAILIPVDTSIQYEFLAGKREYLNKGAVFSINEEYSGLVDGQVFNVEIELDKIFQGVDIIIDNIYYDYNKASIREDAKPALDYLAKVLLDNPAIRIELTSHTDCRGEDDYNLDLSQRRAASAISYIQSSASIDAQRMTAKGKGESSPEIECECDNCTEEEHQINRRTTFRVE